jgi:DNA-binding CsgD family transcriptional regulator
MIPISPLRPPRFEMHAHHIDCVLVSERSVTRWWAFEEVMLDKFQVPRIVGKAHSLPWQKEFLTSLGFDGQIQFDMSQPPWILMNQLSETIRTCETRGWRPPTFRRELLDATSFPDVTNGDETNVNVLRLLAFGLSDKSIASALCLAPHTIRNRISRMLGAGGFENRTALALSYLRTHRLHLQQDGLRTSHLTTTASTNFRNSPLSS